MNCRVMKKDEFVERMLADQELRRKKKSDAAFKARSDLFGYFKQRDLQMRRSMGTNSATRFRRKGTRS